VLVPFAPCGVQIGLIGAHDTEFAVEVDVAGTREHPQALVEPPRVHAVQPHACARLVDGEAGVIEQADRVQLGEQQARTQVLHMRERLAGTQCHVQPGRHACVANDVSNHGIKCWR
jgi:hypothetical protein